MPNFWTIKWHVCRKYSMGFEKHHWVNPCEPLPLLVSWWWGLLRCWLDFTSNSTTSIWPHMHADHPGSLWCLLLPCPIPRNPCASKTSALNHCNSDNSGSVIYKKITEFHSLGFTVEVVSTVNTKPSFSPKNHGPSKKEGFESVFRRVLGSPNHQFWDPMILRE